MMILIISVLLFARKYYALSDSKMLSYHWKAYKGCELRNGHILEQDELNKIGKQWQISYRWVDNTVFLHIENDPEFGDCVYIGK